MRRNRRNVRNVKRNAVTEDEGRLERQVQLLSRRLPAVEQKFVIYGSSYTTLS